MKIDYIKSEENKYSLFGIDYMYLYLSRIIYLIIMANYNYIDYVDEDKEKLKSIIHNIENFLQLDNKFRMFKVKDLNKNNSQMLNNIFNTGFDYMNSLGINLPKPDLDTSNVHNVINEVANNKKMKNDFNNIYNVLTEESKNLDKENVNISNTLKNVIDKINMDELFQNFGSIFSNIDDNKETSINNLKEE